MARLGTTSRHAIYACGVGVMRLLLSSSRRDAARVPIILINPRQRRCPVTWTLLVVIISLNHHLGLFSFTCTRGWPMDVRVHHHFTYPYTRRASTWMTRDLAGLRVRGELNILPTSSRLFFESSALLKPARYCLLDGRVYSTHACPSWWRCPAGRKLLAMPELASSVKISQGTSLISEQLGDHSHYPKHHYHVKTVRRSAGR